jgi:hypothetical protein
MLSLWGKTHLVKFLKSVVMYLKIYSFCKNSQISCYLSEKKLLILKSDTSLNIYSCYTNSQIRCYLSEEKVINPKVWCYFSKDIFILYKFSYLMPSLWKKILILKSDTFSLRYISFVKSLKPDAIFLKKHSFC